MVSFFLKAKHWQLFVLMFVIPMSLYIFFMYSFFMAVMEGADSDPSFALHYFAYFPLLVLLLVGVYAGWFWSVAMGLQPLVPTGSLLKVSRFKLFFFVPLLYSVMALLFMFFVLQSAFNDSQEYDTTMLSMVTVLVVPLHLFAVFCVFFCMYFVAKTFKTVDWQRTVTFTDFAGEFFLVWFFPIGVWILQPKLNKMAEGLPS